MIGYSEHDITVLPNRIIITLELFIPPILLISPEIPIGGEKEKSNNREGRIIIQTTDRGNKYLQTMGGISSGEGSGIKKVTDRLAAGVVFRKRLL